MDEENRRLKKKMSDYEKKYLSLSFLKNYDKNTERFMLSFRSDLQKATERELLLNQELESLRTKMALKAREVEEKRHEIQRLREEVNELQVYIG